MERERFGFKRHFLSNSFQRSKTWKQLFTKQNVTWGREGGVKKVSTCYLKGPKEKTWWKRKWTLKKLKTLSENVNLDTWTKVRVNLSLLGLRHSHFPPFKVKWKKLSKKPVSYYLRTRVSNTQPAWCDFAARVIIKNHMKLQF